MSDFDLMSGFDKGRDSLGDTAPLTTSTTTQPPSEGSNRDSLNLDDFEKVEADQLFGAPTSTVSSGVANVAESTQAAAVGLVDDVMAQVKNSGQDLFSNFTSTGIPSASETKKKDVSPMSDPFKIEADFGKDTNVSFAPSDMFSSDLISSSDDKTGGSGLDVGFTGIPASESFTSDLLASAPPPPSTNLFDDFSPKHDEKPFDDFMSKSDDKGMGSFDDFKSKTDDKDMSSLDDFMSKSDDKGMHDFSIPDIKEAVKNVADPVFDSFSAFSSQPPLLADPSPIEPVKRDPSPDLRNPTPPRTPTAPVPDLASPKQPTPPRTPTPPPREPTPPMFKETTLPPKQPTPPRTPTPPPREPTPPPKEPTPPPKEPTPPPKEPTPPPKEPTPPPKEPTPPPKVPTPPPKVPTPPPKVPTPPPREPTPPPREPTPPPREPTPPPREPTPPPREPTPPPRKPTPPREPTPPPRTPTPPPLLVKATPSAPLQEPTVSPGRSYAVSTTTKNAFNVFKPRAWFNPDQLDPRVVDLIYWRDVKKTGVVFGSLMVILLSLAYLSLISVVAYTSLALLTGTITFRVYKNIMQAVQKSQDGHPFKCILEMDTDLPSEKVHEATDVIVSQINSTISELKRLFLVEDLVDSVKFGCLLWCLTYLGSWFNGLTLVILAVVALFSLPKVYEQNQTQIDQYVGLVRSQVNDVMSKVKAALPIGNKEKAQ